MHAVQQLQALLRTRTPVVHEPLFFQMTIEQCMNPAMRGFLAYETLHFGFILLLLCSRQLLVAVTHGIDKKLLTDRETHGQRVEEGSAKRVTFTPVTCNGRFEVDQQAADDEICHGRTHKDE